MGKASKPEGSANPRRRRARMIASVILIGLLASGCEAAGQAPPLPTNGVRDGRPAAESRPVPLMTSTEPLRLVVVGDSIALPGVGCGSADLV